MIILMNITSNILLGNKNTKIAPKGDVGTGPSHRDPCHRLCATCSGFAATLHRQPLGERRGSGETGKPKAHSWLWPQEALQTGWYLEATSGTHQTCRRTRHCTPRTCDRCRSRTACAVGRMSMCASYLEVQQRDGQQSARESSDSSRRCIAGPCHSRPPP